jgi:Skp family chaperone for outer membrane proteins
MNRFRTTAPLVILFVLAVAAAGYAQQASKIAVINSEQAFQTSVEGKKAVAQITERENKVKAEMQKQDDAIRLLENKLTTGRLTMTNEALMGIQADIETQKTKRKQKRTTARQLVRQQHHPEDPHEMVASSRPG